MLEKLTNITQVAQGRIDYGPTVAVIDIGSNSVRLVVYEGLTRCPSPLFNEKTLAGLGREVQIEGTAGSRRGREGARRAQALPRPLRHHAGRAAVGARHRGLSRCPERQGLHRRSRADLPHQDRRDLRPARSRVDRAWRGLGLLPARRHRRRSRRRLARTGRRLRRPAQARHHAAARRPGPAGSLRQIDQEGREDGQNRPKQREAAQGRRGQKLLRHRRHLAGARPIAHGADGLSAARHAWLRDPGQRGAGVCPAGAPGQSGDVVARSKSSTPPAGRCCPTRRWCWSTSCARPSRATWCSPRSACAKACSIRCSTPRSARRIRCSPRRKN